MIKFLNEEKTLVNINGSTVRLESPENWESIGDGPTREYVLNWLDNGNIPEPLYTNDEMRFNALTAKLKSIDAIYQSKMYCSTPVEFPNGIKNIQLRSSGEYNFFISSITEAMIYVINGLPDTNVIYRTEDNIVQTLTAAQMVIIGQNVKSSKTNVAQAAWNHKDSVRLLYNDITTTAQQIIDYNETTGWPL